VPNTANRVKLDCSKKRQCDAEAQGRRQQSWAGAAVTSGEQNGDCKKEKRSLPLEVRSDCEGEERRRDNQDSGNRIAFHSASMDDSRHLAQSRRY
jgi:hypothetical protein